jgi:hypothetical protein
MRSAFLIGLIALGSLAGSSFGQAQHAASSPGIAPAPSGHAAPIANSGSHLGANHRSAVAGSPAARRSAASKPNPRDIDALGASTMAPRFVGPVSPGGFVNPLGGTNGGHQRSKKTGTNQLVIFGGGFGYVADDSQLAAEEQTQDDDQNQADGQQSGGQQESQYAAVQPSRGHREQPQEVADDTAQDAESGPVAPIPDVGSFTLVTRGGFRLDAVAFTRSNDRLVYITPDGGRRTIAMRDLDVDSTQRLNQELGTPIEIPSDDGAAAKPNSKPSLGATN